MLDLLIRLVELSAGLILVMPVLLIITLAVSIERLYFLKRVLRQGRDIQSNLRQVSYQSVNGLQGVAEKFEDTLQGHLVSTAMSSRGESAEDMEMHLEEEILDAMPRITRSIWILDTSVTIAPLFGLFGTIIGMIQVFNVLGVSSAPEKVTGGISDALISTGSGLLIAIIAVYFVNYFNSLTQQIMHQLELIKLILINRTHGNGLNATSTAGVSPLPARGRFSPAGV